MAPPSNYSKYDATLSYYDVFVSHVQEFFVLYQFCLKKVIDQHHAGFVDYPVARLRSSTTAPAGLALLFEDCSRQERAMESNSCVLKGLVI